MMKTGIVLILFVIFITSSILLYQLFRYRKIKKSSFTDRLTNVYNRNYLEEIEDDIDLNEYILVVFDIDHFKKVNDTYGHDAGDKVLQEIGAILLNILRMDDDIAIRYGGEEFVLLIKSNTGFSEDSESIVQRVYERVKNNKFYIDDEKYINITISVGVNKEPSKEDKFADAFKVADLALYEAKNSGRDTIRFAV
jgi:diguanylate cyclase (GGDEF)-like protein